MSKKPRLDKGYLTSKGNPTEKALEVYMCYILNLPKGWNILKLNDIAVQAVRDRMGFNYGFSVMIMWGIKVSCAKSKTSSGRYIAMSKAYHDALGKLGQGYVLSVKPKH